LAYCKSVTLLIRGDILKADPGTIEKVSSNPKMKIIKYAVPKEVKGDKFVSSYVYTDAKSQKDVEIPVTGIFVEIGSLPNTDFAKDVIKLDDFNRVVTDPKNQRASINGIWAAGDCTDGLYHQNNIAAGDAVKAIEDIYSWLHTK
jgi:thioredoxin reductase